MNESHIHKDDYGSDSSQHKYIRYRPKDDAGSTYLAKAMMLAAKGDAWNTYQLTLNDILDMDVETYLLIKKSLEPKEQEDGTTDDG